MTIQKNLKFYLIAVFVCVFAIGGVILADTIVNHYYGEVALDQNVIGGLGAVTAIGGICDGSEPTTQLCNVNAYELEIQTDLTISGETVTEGFTQGGGCLAISTTSATRTLTEAEMLGYNCIELSAVSAGGQAALALTLPATSTMTTLLATVGNFREWIIDDQHSAAATTTTITAGTGIDLIAVTANDDLIDGGEWARLTCIRQTDTDVTCIVSELVAAD